MSEHNTNFKKVLDRAKGINLKLNPLKCRFRVREVKYVRHIFTNDGLKPDPSKPIVINELLVLTDVTNSQRFLGMVNYLGKFILNFSELSAPLRQLALKDATWSWYTQHQRSFDTLKQQLSCAPTLAYFDVILPVTITCDALSMDWVLPAFRAPMTVTTDP